MKDLQAPQHFQYIIPIVEVLKELGGSGRAGEVTDLVVEKLDISESEINETISSGQSRIKNQIQWARFILVKTGYLKSSIRGVWSLTEKGFKAELTKEYLLYLYGQRKQIEKEYRKQRKEGNGSGESKGTEPIANGEVLQEDYRVSLPQCTKKPSTSRI